MHSQKHPARLKLGRDELSWYWNRIKNVPPGELPYRVDQLIRKKVDKHLRRFATPELYTGDRLDIRPIPHENVRAIDENDKQSILNAADESLKGKYRYFGLEVDFSGGIDWHGDPKTGRSWPLDYWGDINYRDASIIGGIKFAWELNRLHHFPVLALATAISGEDRYVDELFRQLEDWIEKNPYPIGINWISGIELGIRLVNLLYALKICPDSVTADRQKLIVRFVGDHGRHLYRYPSKYTSAQNHALAEAIGLFVAGTAFPGFKSADKWRSFGKRVLEHEVQRQIQPDGSCFEDSVPYLQFICDHFLLYRVLCSEYGDDWGQQIDIRLQAALTFIDTVLDQRGNYAMIGDDDSGYLLKFWDSNHNNFHSLLNSASVLYPDLSISSNRSAPDSKTILLFGSKAMTGSAGENTHLSPAVSKSSYFPDSGLAVFKTSEKEQVHLVCNGGPLALEPLGAHGHCDALSFWLSINGHPIFVDPGTYLYHSGGIWRDYFRSTAAHNTIRIDQKDQATILADFIYEDFYEVSVPDIREDAEIISWSAQHDGYHRLHDPVTHRRTVALNPRQSTIHVRDELKCEDSHIAELYFHLHPECQVHAVDNGFSIACHDVLVTITVDARDCQIEEIRADQEARGGWYSPAFNVIEPASTLKFSFRFHGDRELQSLIRWQSI